MKISTMPKAYLIGGSQANKENTKKAMSSIANAPRMVTVISSTKVCKRCMIFCMETKPYFKLGESARYFREQSAKNKRATFPITKVWCKNGCHERFPTWGWSDIGERFFVGKHLPTR